MSSLRTRLLIGLTGLMSLLVAGFGGMIYLAISRSLTESFEEGLRVESAALATLLDCDENGVEMEFDDRAMPEFSRAKRPHYFQLRDVNGTTMERSLSLQENDLPLPESSEPLRMRAIRLPDGRPGRVAERRVTLDLGEDELGEDELGEDERGEDELGEDERGEDEPALVNEGQVRHIVLLSVARDTLDLDRQLAQIAWQVPLVGLGTILLALLCGFVLVSRGLRPLGAMADEISGIDDADLTLRVAVARMPAEVQAVGDQLNTLLGKIEAAFHRERGFTADVAHELRTPLAGMLTTIEVALSRERDNAEYREALEDSLELVRHQQAMVEQLLELARLDAGDISPASQQVDLCRLVDDCWATLVGQAARRELTFENQLDGPWNCQSDSHYLSIILANVLDNAVSYADAGGQIQVAGEASVDGLRLTISNTGCTLTREDLAVVFDRFWRKDPARGSAGAHCGIGLALTQRVAELLGFEVGVALAPDQRFVFSLAIPAAAAFARG